MKKSKKNNETIRGYKIRWALVLLDFLILSFVCFMLLWVYKSFEGLSVKDIITYSVVFCVCIFVARFFGDIYRQVWRYGGVQSYLRLIIVDFLGFALFFAVTEILHIGGLTFARRLSLFCTNLLASLVMRMVYRYAYKCADESTCMGKLLKGALRLFGTDSSNPVGTSTNKVKVAIVGAGRVGISLAEDFLSSERGQCIPVVFFDNDPEKCGKQIHGIPVISDQAVSEELLESYGVQEIIFALPQLDGKKKKELYDFYSVFGCRLKVYDYPIIQDADKNGKKFLRDFDIEDLLFRKPIVINSQLTRDFYRGKTVLITGGGGSIGSELCRQIAKMSPKKLVILDIAENGAYDVQQELKMNYGSSLNLCVEIVSVCNKAGLERVFAEHKPQIVIMAAAHKHVPLMEKNCIEAVENNVFGTLNTIELAVANNVERVIMVSTDKAVNPTNVMGATKRVCEMIVRAYSESGCKTTFSTTRFGNVLGSAGSVIPLFRRQIAAGGPVTVTDRRIIRYFMTIPEASQLVLESGAMAKNGELFVLDMGQPVRILDLAENMIRLCGMEPGEDIQILETGLRPGEKLYEELLVKSETLGKTENSLIFIEKDTALNLDEIALMMDKLKDAALKGSDENMRDVLKQVVPTFKSPEEINRKAE